MRCELKRRAARDGLKKGAKAGQSKWRLAPGANRALPSGAARVVANKTCSFLLRRLQFATAFVVMLFVF
jgi:hypothetical protein